MRKIILLLLLTSCITTSKFSPSTIIKWSNDYKLTWQDFGGKTQLESDFSAVTVCDMVFVYEKYPNHIKFDFYAYFNKESSWSNKLYQDTATLNHEQIHFDIAELNSRIERQFFTKKIHTYNYDTIINDIRNMHMYFYSEKNKMETKYDLETDHGLNKIVQKQWSNAIKAGIDTLSEYSNSEIIYYF